MALAEDGKSGWGRGDFSIGEALRWGVRSVSSEFSAVLVGIVAFVAQTALAIALALALGATFFSWASRLLNDVLGQLSGAEDVLASGPSFSPVAVALFAASLVSGITLLLLRGLWVGTLIPRLVRKNARALKSVGDKGTGPLTEGGEVILSNEGEVGSEKGALSEGIQALPTLLKLVGVFSLVALTAFAICGTLVIFSWIVFRTLFGAMVFEDASLMAKVMLGWLLAFSGILMAAVALGTFCLFRLSVVRVLALEESPLEAIAASARSLVQAPDFYALAFGVFTLVAGLGWAGICLLTWIPDFVLQASTPAFIAAAFFALVLAVGAAAFRACAVSAEYVALTAGVLADAGLWAIKKTEPKTSELPSHGGDLILATHVVTPPRTAEEVILETTIASLGVEAAFLGVRAREEMVVETKTVIESPLSDVPQTSAPEANQADIPEVKAWEGDGDSSGKDVAAQEQETAKPECDEENSPTNDRPSTEDPPQE